MKPTILLLLAMGVTGAVGLSCHVCDQDIHDTDVNCTKAPCVGDDIKFVCAMAKLANGNFTQNCLDITAATDATPCKPSATIGHYAELTKVCCSTNYCNVLPIKCSGPRPPAASALLLVCIAVSVLVLVLE